MKITAIHGGGDWYDASVDYLVLPEGLDIQAEHLKWRNWIATEYYLNQPSLKYKSFPDWLIEQGARHTTQEELVIFW